MSQNILALRRNDHLKKQQQQPPYALIWLILQPMLIPWHEWTQSYQKQERYSLELPLLLAQYSPPAILVVPVLANSMGKFVSSVFRAPLETVEINKAYLSSRNSIQRRNG
ncbi:hypothetical protein PoB_003666900 [Plakobranchus ocellatus]|uniref:Uncharacterized protein n=1 Tax=Plakobranchus ocellatus TaxID=259542 RepID=A0AAV4AV22_9GAST|nr:hypothetical protein PoB_003666900 [Plakobranchus ocellatus]